MGRITRWVVVWLAHVGLWLVYVSQINTWELLVGAAAAGLATLGVYVFGRLKLVECYPSLREIAEVWRTPGYALTDTGKVLQGMGQQLFSKRGARSVLAAVPFEWGQADAACAGRRALAEFYTTLTPNSVVLGIVREQGLLLYHQLVPDVVPPLTQNLGAKP